MWTVAGRFLRSNALGLVAIFIALGGTAAAVSSTGSGDGTKVGQPDARSAQLREQAVLVRRGKRGPRGFPGPQGPQGPAGQNGQNGAPGPGATRLDFDQPETDNTIRPLGTQNELTVSSRCSQSSGLTRVELIMTSTVAATVSGSVVEDGTSTGAFNLDQTLVANTPANFIAPIGPNSAGFFLRLEVQAVYRSATRTISLPLHILAADAVSRCFVQGVAIPAT